MKFKALLIPTITLVASTIMIKLLILPVLNALVFSVSAFYILYRIIKGLTENKK